ncbi:DUF7601 domain-containing protein [Catenisphaera adipataccumulans]|uniref:DUF7601 domain-containing protein n=1 Tax=Catenisphaera adipataccumulans TaxID=700500 RepID=A0A7W8CY29_9FIRM|nr:hypothetical protein [Catenisphaera adipataccumulans]MBB5182568.1 hypothetical protein [Catenisphaera adipataccumulans]
MQLKRNSVLRWIALFFCLAACFFCFRMTAFAEETQSADDPTVVLDQETDNAVQQSTQKEKSIQETESSSLSTINETAETNDSDKAAVSEETGVKKASTPITTASVAETETVEKGDHVYNTEISSGSNRLGYVNVDPDSEQRLIDYYLSASYYVSGNTIVAAKSKNIIAYIVPQGKDAKNYNVFLSTDSTLHLDLTEEILKWGQEHGKNWTKETLIKNFSFDFKAGAYFYDENGKPVNFIDLSLPYYVTNPYDSGEPWIDFYFLNSFDWNDWRRNEDQSVDREADHIAVELNNNSLRKNGEDLLTCSLDDLPYISAEANPAGIHFDPNYRGILNVELIHQFTCKFEIDGQKYEILIHNPKDVEQFIVEDGTVKSEEMNTSDADMRAEIKTTDQDGTTTIRSDSENETITGVVRGDQITYKIDLDLSAEREMLFKLYQGIALEYAFDAEFSEEVQQFFEDHRMVLPWLYISGQPNRKAIEFYPTITFTFTLPKDKDANGNYDLIVDEDALKNVQLIQENPNGSPLWQLDPSKTQYDAVNRILTFTAYLSPDEIVQDFIKIGDDKIFYLEHEKVLTLINSMIDSKLTAVISGVRVSDLAEVGKPFTVKAKVSGSLDYINDYLIILADPPAPAAKPNPGGDFEDADAGWDEDVSYQSARRAVRMLCAVAAASAEGTYTEDDLYSPLNVSDYDLHQLLFGHFAWTHLQDPSTKDVIQSEDNSEEFWYTVIIPSLDITKEVEGINTDQEFNFELKLDDAAMAGPFNGTTYNAELHENGTVQNIAVNFKNGVATFKLKNGQTIRIIVPFDTHFTLRETDHNGYFVTIDKNGNRIFSDTLSGIIESYTSLEDIEANKNAYTFTNEYEEPEQPEEPKEANVEETRSTGVQTGVMTQTGMWMVLALASIVILHKQRA